MCDDIQSIRILLFAICAVMVFGGIYAIHRFCKRKGIDMNTFPGMFEMYRRVFAFEERAFSLLVLVCMYGSAVLGLMAIALTLWGAGQGCEFPIGRNTHG
ncbi:hypothetical protein [Burkholderia diffusa]|jgi:hypothetical protein|uniref:hypothetical protein n=1 Tax=Burkholderia diffusa TaxID=488732 RepID=UPI00158AA2E0|nr:hypothetical protein [Burkholderia diffusa]